MRYVLQEDPQIEVVGEAGDGIEAVEAAGELQPDVVLLDVVMPEIDGFEVLAQMQADSELRHIPVIMISGVDDTDAIVRCLGAGADDFLPKPFDPAILRARIDAGLNRSRLRTLEQDRVREVFTRFLPEQIAAEMLAASDGRPLIRAVRLWATLMFVDLRGFTRFADDGGLHRFINVYLNDEDVRYLGSLETPVADGDTVSILPAVAGGSRRLSVDRALLGREGS